MDIPKIALLFGNQEQTGFNLSISFFTSATSQGVVCMATHELSPPKDFTSGQYIPDEKKFNFRAVSSHEIRRAVMSFSSNKVPGFDKVTMSVIRCAPLHSACADRHCESILIVVSLSCSVENI